MRAELVFSRFASNITVLVITTNCAPISHLHVVECVCCLCVLVGQSERPSCYLLDQPNTYALSVVHSDISDLAIGMQFSAHSNFAEVDSRVTSVSGCVCVSASVFVYGSGFRSDLGRLCLQVWLHGVQGQYFRGWCF